MVPSDPNHRCKGRRAPEPRRRGYAIVVLLLRTLDNHAFGVAGTGSGYGVLRLLQLEAQHAHGGEQLACRIGIVQVSQNKKSCLRTI